MIKQILSQIVRCSALCALVSACEPQRAPSAFDMSGPSTESPDEMLNTSDLALDLGVEDRDLALDAAPLPSLDMTSPTLDSSLPASPMSAFCDSEGLTSRPRQEGGGDYQFGSIAGDFTAQTLRGAWRLSEQWSGCESYVFLVYFPDLRSTPSGAWVGDQLWESDVADLLRSPNNTHYFFLSFEEDPQARQDRMVELNNRFIRSLSAGESLPERRLHFVTDRATEVEGSVGAFLSDYLDYMFSPSSVVNLGDRGDAQAPLPFVFGIDRLQRWDSGGSLNEVVGRPMLLSMASHIGPFYNHIAEVYEEAEQGLGAEVTLVDARISERVFLKTVELPSVSELERYTSLELDVSVTCPHRNVYACSEWDRIARVSYCTDAECAESFEMARWITPYWRRGERRWVWDASTSLPWLASGGSQTFKVELGPSWERATERDVKVSLRLGEESAETRVIDAQLAFKGGAFDASYNDRAPFTFIPPEGARRVELVLLLSGHGQTAQDNCAEWCDHRHHFTINGQELPVVQHEGDLGSASGCAAYASRGVSPGQYGNWAPERAFWCPGLPVYPLRLDLTDYIQAGGENTLIYRATLGSDLEPRGGDIALSAYVVSSQ